MNDNAILLSTIWGYLDDIISDSDKPQVADALVKSFIENGSDARELLDAEGEYEELDKAILENSEDEYI